MAQLLDRKWWRRVWTVQEAVLAKKVVIVCGPDEVSLQALRSKLRVGWFGIVDHDMVQGAKSTEEGTAIAKYAFPDAEYTTLMDLQNQWRSETWNWSLYYFLYTFRRFESTASRDRVYAFLGLACDIEALEIVPDYSSSTSTIFTDIEKNDMCT